MIFTDTQKKRILGNFGFAFFTALSAANLAGAGPESLKIGLIMGLIQGGLAAFVEIKAEADDGTATTAPPKTPILSSVLLL